MFFGNPPLTSGYTTVTLPLIGSFDVTSALVFDAGVYFIVVGLTLHILTSMGGYLDQEEDNRKQYARQRARELQEKNKRRRAEQAAKRLERESRREAVTGDGDAAAGRGRASTIGAPVHTTARGRERSE